jgi:hypothetical protein
VFSGVLVVKKCRFFPFWEIVETTQKGSSGIAVREIW